MKKLRFVLILSLVFVIGFCLLKFGIADNEKSKNVNSENYIKPPTGLVGNAKLTSVDLYWTNSSDFEGRVDGYFVYYWQTDQGFYAIQPVSKEIVEDQFYHIENLRPNTQYSFVVRAATTQENDKLEKQGKFYLSQVSNEYKISTKPDIRIDLLMSNVEGAVFQVSKYIPRKNEWFDEKFYTHPGGVIGSVKKIDDLEIDFRTGYVLHKTQIKSIPEESPKITKFADPRDSSIEITVPNNSKAKKSSIMYEVILIDADGNKILLKKNN